MRTCLISLLPLLSLLYTTPALPQTATPQMPAPIQALADEGAQMRYMGRNHGLDGWLSIKNGQEQYFYVPPGGTGFVMGILFDNAGKVVTIDQIQTLTNSDDTLLTALSPRPDLKAPTPDNKPTPSFQSPAERLFHETERTNWVPLGPANAPAVYAIIDPQCPHCHALISQLKSQDHFKSANLQLRVIPVGFTHESEAQSAFLIASPDPETSLLNHLSGDEEALPVRADISLQGVQRNVAYMQSWAFDVTPLLIYRNASNTIKIVRGHPKDINAILADLPAKR